MKKTIAIVAPILLFLIGCRTDMTHIEKGDIASPQKILIAGTSSDFKMKVISQIMDSPKLEQSYFKVIGLSELNKAETKLYQVILLVSAFMAGQIDGRVKQFLQKNPTDPRVIVFYTIGQEDHPPAASKKLDGIVDAISSASLLNRTKDRADELSALIEKRFASF